MSTSRSHVSVVVPCFNRAETVRPAIESVLAQDYPSFDVIAVDDQSTDKTLETLHGIADPRLTVIENPGPKGVCGARNAGAARARGSWIAFQDSDDLWRPGKLTRQMQRAATGDSVAVYCAMEIVEGEGDARHRVGRVPPSGARHLEGDLRPGLAMTSLISTQTLVVRRDVFEAVGGFDPAFEALVDWELMLRVAEHGSVAYVDEELVEQRMSANSITRSTEKRLAAQERILAKHGALLARYPGALAHHHYRIAGAHRDFGRFEIAAAHIRKARVAAPHVLRYRLALAYTMLRGLVAARRP